MSDVELLATLIALVWGVWGAVYLLLLALDLLAGWLFRRKRQRW